MGGRRATAAALAAAAVVAGCAAPPPAGGLLQKAASQKSLVVGVTADVPGLGLRVGGTYSGFEVQVATLVARGLGVPADGVVWRPTPPADAVAALARRQVDLLLTPYPVDAVSRRDVSFAGPFYDSGPGLLVRAGTAVAGPVAPPDARVCTVRQAPAGGTAGDDRAAAACVTALVRGRVDAVTGDDLVLAGRAARFPGALTLVAAAGARAAYGIGLPRGDAAACARVGALLRAAAADGTLRAAWDATLGAGGLPAPPLDPAARACG
jgi:glutamate transport system substrate-binding protein